MTDSIRTATDPRKALCQIRVFGIGGCGNNAINHMVSAGMSGPTLIAANTDVADLERCLAPVKIQVGAECTEGLGAGGDPAVGRVAAEESMEEIAKLLSDSHIVFVTAGLGGGTGTGGAPAVVEHLSKLKKPPLIVSVVILPFDFERDRLGKARPAQELLLRHSNSLISISNAKLKEALPDGSLKQCRQLADDVLYRAVSCITELILKPGDIHLDFADIRSALSAKGRAIMGFGQASGEGRGLRAVEMAITCPLMENQSIRGAKFLLINIIADDIKLSEFEGINDYLVKQASPEVRVFSGYSQDESLREAGTLKVTVIATGLDQDAGQARPGEDEEEPITLLVEPEPQIALAPEAMAVNQTPQAIGVDRLGPGPEIHGPQQVGQGAAPQKRVVRLSPAPMGRLPQAGGHSKYESNSIADPSGRGLSRSMSPRTLVQPARPAIGAGARGVEEARSPQTPSFMINKAD